MSVEWKYIWIILILIMPLSITAQEPESKLPTLSDTITFTVYGMDCPGCERGLEKQINKIPAVHASEASWVNQQLKVIVAKDSTLQREDIEFRVKKANFTLADEILKEEQ